MAPMRSLSLHSMVGPLLAAMVSVPGVVGAVPAKPVLPWIDDDYARAVATAKTRKLPMFVESWAPW